MTSFLALRNPSWTWILLITFIRPQNPNYCLPTCLAYLPTYKTIIITATTPDAAKKHIKARSAHGPVRLLAALAPKGLPPPGPPPANVGVEKVNEVRVAAPPPPPPTKDVDPASEASDVALAGVTREKVAEMSWKADAAAAEAVARTETVLVVVVMLDVTTEAAMATE